MRRGVYLLKEQKQCKRLTIMLRNSFWEADYVSILIELFISWTRDLSRQITEYEKISIIQ